MLFKRLNRVVWLLLPLWGLSQSLVAAAPQQDSGPLPPPKGPYFSSKPLLYFGEEISVEAIRSADYQAGNTLPTPLTGMGGYPRYNIPAPYAFAPNQRPFQRLPPPPQGWAPGSYYPRYQTYPGFPGQQPYPAYRGYPSSPTFPNRGGR